MSTRVQKTVAMEVNKVPMESKHAKDDGKHHKDVHD